MRKTLALLVSLSALAAHAALYNFSGGGNVLSVGPGTAGFEFQSTVNATVGALGLFDEFSDGVLNGSHQIGLWNAQNGHLIAQATVSPGSAIQQAGFFWANLPASILLPPGTYRLAGLFADVDLDLARANVPAGNVTTQSGFMLKDAYLSSGSGFEMPALDVSQVNFGFFGPNLDFAAVVPEPMFGTLAAALALAGFGLWRKMRAVL